MRFRMLRNALSTVAALSIICGCRSDAPRRAREATGPHLTILDSIQIKESDSLYIGDPVDFVVDPTDGSFYVSDAFFDHVIRYSRGGEPMMVYGRPGGGPGEFRAVKGVFILNDSTIAVLDSGKRLLNIYERDSANYRGLKPIRSPVVVDAVVTKDGVWFGGLNESRSFSIGAWTSPEDSLRYGGPVPTEWRQHYGYMTLCGRIQLAPWQNSLLVGFCGMNDLIIVDQKMLIVRDTVNIPAVRRRGVPDDIVEIIREALRSPKKQIGALSLLLYIYRLPSGNIAVVYGDVIAKGELPNLYFSSTLYLSMLSADLRRACVDRMLPTADGIDPVITFHADTMFVLDRHIEGDSLETWIETYRITDSGCTWIPTGFTG